jgi:hypothetical protein
MIPPIMDRQIRNVIIELFPRYDKNNNNKLSASELVGFLNDAMDLFRWKVRVSKD